MHLTETWIHMFSTWLISQHRHGTSTYTGMSTDTEMSTLGHQPTLMNTDLEHWDVITDCQRWESAPSLTPRRQHWALTLSENTGEHWGSTPSISTGCNTWHQHWVQTLSANSIDTDKWTLRHEHCETLRHEHWKLFLHTKYGKQQGRNWGILHQLTEFGKTVKTILVSDKLPGIYLDQTKIRKWYSTW